MVVSLIIYGIGAEVPDFGKLIIDNIISISTTYLRPVRGISVHSLPHINNCDYSAQKFEFWSSIFAIYLLFVTV